MVAWTYVIKFYLLFWIPTLFHKFTHSVFIFTQPLQFTFIYLLNACSFWLASICVSVIMYTNTIWSPWVPQSTEMLCILAGLQKAGEHSALHFIKSGSAYFLLYCGLIVELSRYLILSCLANVTWGRTRIVATPISYIRQRGTNYFAWLMTIGCAE